MRGLELEAGGGTHLTFAATEDIASFLRFFLLDTAVPMLTWKRRRQENSSFQKEKDGWMRQWRKEKKTKQQQKNTI